MNEQMRAINRARGLRLRKSNIQIGNEHTLEKLHREQRGNFYFFGEVYAVHPDLLPNSRRDYFIENQTYKEFEKKLKVHFYKLKDLYYAASNANSATKKIEEYKNARKDFVKKTENTGFIDKEEQKNEIEKLKRKKDQAKAAETDLQRLMHKHENDRAFSRVITKVTENKDTFVETLDLSEFDNKPKFRTDKLSSLNKDQRKFLGKIFSVIRDVLDENTAEELIKKIEEKVK
jgi:molecular chaperone HtpG